MTTRDTDIIKRSATQGDYNPTPTPAIVYAWGASSFQRRQADLPAWWSHHRDWVLRATPTQDPLWAGAVIRSISKIAALGWEVADEQDSAQRVRRSQELLLSTDAGAGWVPFIAKVLRDFLTTDNGAFVEVVRASSAQGSRILGLTHLDSLRCTRTGNEEVPVLYRDRAGAEHALRWWQVLSFADMPDPGASYFGVGLCAASRCYPTIARMAAMNLYLLEKMSGDGATELEFISGLGPDQLQNALLTADQEQKRRGAIHYKGKVVVPIMSDIPVSGYSVPLKSVPDGFDPETQRSHAAQDYANNLGIPVQDIIPLSGQGLGTGQQTQILAEAAEGQGLAAWRQQWLHAINEHVLPSSTTFAWSNQNDTRDKKAKAEAQAAQATVITTLIEAGVITPQQGLQMGVDLDLVPREFLPDDQTPGGALDDGEKPIDGISPEQQQAALAAQQMLAQAQAAAAQQPQATKDDGLDALLAQELQAAKRLAQLAVAE